MSTEEKAEKQEPEKTEGLNQGGSLDQPDYGPGHDEAETGDDMSASEGETEPEIDPADLLDLCLEYIERFVALPSKAAGVAMATWAMHAHLLDAYDTSPRMAFLSAEAGSGKTRALEILSLLCPLALETSNATSASIMRAIDDPAGTPTFFIDEIDTVWGTGGKGDENLRGLINAGHRRGKGFLRCGTDKEAFAPTRYSVFAAVAMAGIGNLPDTILSRSINIHMRRRAKGEKVEAFRHRDNGAEGERLRDLVAGWAKKVVKAASVLRPDLPDEICDRKADVWEPLIIVGDLAGGDWPERVRAAALEFVNEAKSVEGMSLGVQLLRDIQACFGEEKSVSTENLIERLVALETGPWGDLSGKPLTPIRLASLLRPYGIKPGTIRLDDETPKGYYRSDFIDAWSRYLP